MIGEDEKLRQALSGVAVHSVLGRGRGIRWPTVGRGPTPDAAPALRRALRRAGAVDVAPSRHRPVSAPTLALAPVSTSCVFPAAYSVGSAA